MDYKKEKVINYLLTKMFQNSFQNGNYFELFDPKSIPFTLLSITRQAEEPVQVGEHIEPEQQSIRQRTKKYFNIII